MSEIGLGVYEKQIMTIVFILLGIVIGLTVIILFSMIFVKLSRRVCIDRLEYHRYFMDKGVYEGQETEFVEEFINHSFLPMFVVDVETHINSDIKIHGCQMDDGVTQWFFSRFFVMPYTKIKRTHRAKCVKRGYYKLETAKITFANIDIYLDSRAEMYVYPREISFTEQNRLNHYMQYSALSKRPLMEDRFSFAGIRNYMAGDALSDINYKQTARRGQLMVNSRDYMLGRKLLIYLNFQPNEEKHLSISDLQELFERQLSMASYLLNQCVENGFGYALCSNAKMLNGDDFVRNMFSTGEGKLEECLCQMAQMGTQYGISMAALMEMDIRSYLSGTEIFLFTTYVDEPLLRRIGELEQLGNIVNLMNMWEDADGA